MISRDLYRPAVQRVLRRVTDETIRDGFAELFASTQEAVNAGRVDVVILAARRLACVYQLLIDAGMPRLTGCLVVSDRYLESMTNKLSGTASIEVLDDSVVVGTTLDRLSQKLAQVAPKASVHYRAVCVDTEQLADFLFDELDFGAICKCSSQEVESYSNQLVIALFDGQVPLFTDFPITQPITMDREAWTSFLTEVPWHVADVTPPGFEDRRQWALTLLPHDRTQRRYLDRLESSVTPLVDAIKIRCFAQETDGTVRIVIVPIAMIRATPPERLRETLTTVANGIRDPGSPLGVGWRDWDIEALHRLVQFYTSACVLAHIWPYVARRSNASQRLNALALRPLPVELNFGVASAAILDAFDRVVAAFENADEATGIDAEPPSEEEPATWPLLGDESVKRMFWATQATLETLGVPEEPAPGHMTKVGAALGQSVSAVFGFINETYELPQREEIRRLGSLAAYRAWDEKDPSRRVLRQGITLRELVENVFPDGLRSDGLWDRSVVSLGIDQGNDLGIIVPVTRYDTGRDLVYRCFRIGETAVLTPRPLINAVGELAVTNDPFIRALLTGEPPVGIQVRIGGDLRKSALHPMTPESLADFVLRRVPGVPVERYEGTVSAVHGEVVEARIVSSGTDELEFAEFPLSRLPSDGHGVRPGTAFVFSVFERTGEMEKSRELKFRLRRVPMLRAAAQD